MVKNKFLFNFAASYSGGGFKRLHAYAEWFDQEGGAWFVVHPSCRSLINKFPNNRFFIVSPSRFQRLFNDCKYLASVQEEIGVPAFYYSYGIPVYHKVGEVNWFHLSNVLPIYSCGIPLSIYDKLRFTWLGKQIERHYINVDVISAESQFSLQLIGREHVHKGFLSVNGNDDELTFQHSEYLEKKTNIATVLGTYRYKALGDSYQVFEMLRENNSALKMVIIGDEKEIPRYLKAKEHVIITGCLPREDVIHHLRKTKYYISTTYIENSYNAAAEGVVFADESFISDIAPHRELLAGALFEKLLVPKMIRSVLHVKRTALTALNLNTWNGVIREMINHICL